MKKSELIVMGELVLISGLGLIFIGRGYLLLCDRVAKLEKQQVKQIENMTKLAQNIYGTKKKKEK